MTFNILFLFRVYCITFGFRFDFHECHFLYLGVLMQQVGCTSKFSVEIARGLVNDYFVLLPECSCKLRELPSKAPLFTANFLTALTEIYFILGKYLIFTKLTIPRPIVHIL